MGRECVIDSSVTLHELRVLLTTKILHKPFNYFNVFFLIYFINQYFIYTFIYLPALETSKKYSSSINTENWKQ